MLGWAVLGFLPRYLRAESVVLDTKEATVGLDYHGKKSGWAVVVHAFNSSTRKSEAGRSL